MTDDNNNEPTEDKSTDSEEQPEASGAGTDATDTSDRYRFNREGIDPAMKRIQWVNWTDNGGSKPPKSPHAPERQASTNDATTWGSFDQAAENAENDDLDVGVGLPMDQTSPFTAIDIDVPDDTDGVSLLDTHKLDGAVVEHSPSADGNLRVLLRGVDVPEWWENQTETKEGDGVGREVKLFDSEIYVTVTGDVLDGYGPPIEATDQDGFESWLIDVWREFNPDSEENPKASMAAEGELAAGSDPEANTKLKELVREHSDRIGEIPEDVEGVDRYNEEDDIAQEFGDKSAELVLRGADYQSFGMAAGMLADEMEFANKSAIKEYYNEARDRYSGVKPESWDSIEYLLEEGDMPEARRGAVSLILENGELITTKDDEKLWRYDPAAGIYREDGKQYIRTLLQDRFGKHYTTHQFNEVVDRIEGQSYVDRETFNGGANDPPFICVKNGVLDLSDPHNPELLDHDPQYRFIQRIPVEYDPEATFDGGALDSFLSEVTRRPEDKRVLLEYLGFCLWPEYDPASFMIIFGSGSNGKGVWLEVIEDHFLGSENTSNVDLHQFTGNDFAGSDLHGKYANIGGDIPGAKIGDLGPLKGLSGGDEKRAEEKYESAFTFENRAKLMFAVNYPPVLGERGYAIKRRILPIHFPTRFTPEDQPGPDLRPKRELMADLTSDEELSGLLNEVLTSLTPVLESGDFSLPESYDERLRYYETFADPIRQFTDVGLENNPASVVTKDAPYEAYKRLCRERSDEPKAKQTFYRTIGTVGSFVSKETRIRDPEADGEQVRCLDRATLTERGKELCPNHLIEDGNRLTLKRYGRADGTVPIEYVTQDAGFIDVKARLRTSRTPGEDSALSFRGTFEDETGTLPAVSFESDVSTDDLRDLGLVGTIEREEHEPIDVEGHVYRLTDVKAGSGTDGEVQLKVTPETQVERIEDEIRVLDSSEFGPVAAE